MSGEAREAILARIAEALADRPDAAPAPYVAPPTAVADPAELLAQRVSEYRAVVRRVGPADVPAAVAEALRERGARRVVVPAGFPGAWLVAAAAEGVELIGDDPPLSHAQLDAIDGVVTTCAVAIAETGTVVLDAGPGQGRRALSLLPDRHVCVVEANRIVADVPAGLARLDPSRPLTWISGPSATSDIELDRVEGVHGPRQLDVIIVDG